MSQKVLSGRGLLARFFENFADELEPPLIFELYQICRVTKWNNKALTTPAP